MTRRSQTNRQTAPFLKEKESRGCRFATSWRNYPFLRMPNVPVNAGPAGSPTPEESIADTKDGVLIDGRGSYSIDSSATTASSAATRPGRSRTARRRGW